MEDSKVSDTIFFFMEMIIRCSSFMSLKLYMLLKVMKMKFGQ